MIPYRKIFAYCRLKPMIKLFSGLCLFISTGCTYTPPKQTPAPAPQKKDDRLSCFLQYHESVFKTNLAATGCPGAAMVMVKDTSVVYIKGFGVKEVGSTDSVDVNTVFRVGSLSKGFTTVLVALLVQKRILHWEDKVVSYIPTFELKDKEQAQRIRIKHILSHTTGLPRHSLIELIEKGQTMQEMIPKLKRLKLEGKEGEFFGYQNVAFSMIQEIIFIKTHKTIQQWMQDEIFTKAGMQHASMSYEELMKEPNKAQPHEKSNSKEYAAVPIHDKYYNTAAAGGINASITDMGKWLQVLLGNRPDITPKGSLDYIFTPFIKHEGSNYFDTWSGITQSAYGMGWRILQYHGKKLICHGGFVNNYRAELAIDPESRVGVCFLFNAQNYYSGVAVPNFFDMYYMYEGVGMGDE